MDFDSDFELWNILPTLYELFGITITVLQNAHF